MHNHENLQAVLAFVVVGLTCFFGFLEIPWFPSPLNWSLAAGCTSIVAAVGIAYFMLHKTSKEDPEKRRELSESLRRHYQDVVDRMEDWDYWPKDSGEMISSKSAETDTPIPTKIPSGGRLIPPLNLTQGLEHLKAFSDAWNIYCDGRERAKELAEERSKVLDHISIKMNREMERLGLQRIGDKCLQSFATIISGAARGDLSSEADRAVTFEEPFCFAPPSLLYKIADKENWLIGGVGGVTLVTTEQVAKSITKILQETKDSKDIQDAIKSVIQGEKVVCDNRDRFLKILHDNIIPRTRSSDYRNEIAKAVCNDCRESRHQLDSLC